MKIDLLTKTLYEVHTTTAFKKSLKKMRKQGKDISKLESVVIQLSNREKLARKYKNHALFNDKYYTDCGECHIEPDWLLIYRYHEEKLILLLVTTGSHSEILNQ